MNGDAPSFWSGVGAIRDPFTDLADYSEWACGLLEEGFDTQSIRVLAGLFHETNLFELRDWHERCLKDLGLAGLGAREVFLALLRGSIEDFLSGRLQTEAFLESLDTLFHEKRDELLEPFMDLYVAYWHFGEFDSGFKSLSEVVEETRKRGRALLASIEGEFLALKIKKPDSAESGFLK